MKSRPLSRLSLSLAFLSALLWIFSIFQSIVMLIPCAPYHIIGLGIIRHSFIFGEAPMTPKFDLRIRNSNADRLTTGFLGFHFEHNSHELLIGLPFWLLILLFTTIFLILRRHPTPLPNHCLTCNYNLTGNQSGTCPECGTSVVSLSNRPIPSVNESMPR